LAKLSQHFGVATDTVALALRRAGVTLWPRRGWPGWRARPLGPGRSPERYRLGLGWFWRSLPDRQRIS
jgi:hypothetical protein